MNCVTSVYGQRHTVILEMFNYWACMEPFFLEISGIVNLSSVNRMSSKMEEIKKTEVKEVNGRRIRRYRKE